METVSASSSMLSMVALIAVRRLAEEGLPAERWLVERSGRHVITMPGGRIPLATGLEAWRWLETVTGGRGVGVELARRFPISNFQFLGTAVITAPHQLAAIQTYCRYFPYLCTNPYLAETRKDDLLEIYWDNDCDSVPFSFRDFIMASLTGLLSLGVREIRPVSITPRGRSRVPFQGDDASNSGHEKEHRDRPATRIELRLSDLYVPLYGSNPTLHIAATQRLAAFDRMRESVVTRVVGALEQLLDVGETRLTAVAALLGSSGRTIQKELAAEGYTYSELLRRIRQRRALKLLTETQIPIGDIAYALGYDSISSFSRAFQSWFGQAPGDVRGLSESA